MTRLWSMLAILVVQVVSAFFFVSDILSSYLPIWQRPIAWEYRELMEVGAALGLVLGVGLGAWALWRSHKERHQAEERLRRASGAFMDLLDERFREWSLTPAEADVALFAIKGLSTAEIAAPQARQGRPGARQGAARPRHAQGRQTDAGVKGGKGLVARASVCYHAVYKAAAYCVLC